MAIDNEASLEFIDKHLDVLKAENEDLTWLFWLICVAASTQNVNNNRIRPLDSIIDKHFRHYDINNLNHPVKHTEKSGDGTSQERSDKSARYWHCKNLYAFIFQHSSFNEQKFFKTIRTTGHKGWVDIEDWNKIKSGTGYGYIPIQVLFCASATMRNDYDDVLREHVLSFLEEYRDDHHLWTQGVPEITKIVDKYLLEIDEAKNAKITQDQNTSASPSFNPQDLLDILSQVSETVNSLKDDNEGAKNTFADIVETVSVEFSNAQQQTSVEFQRILKEAIESSSKIQQDNQEQFFNSLTTFLKSLEGKQSAIDETNTTIQESIKALIASIAQISEQISSAQSILAQKTEHQYALQLDPPPILEDNINYYGNRTIDVIGRDEEQEYLRNFLKPDEVEPKRQFRWLQLAGVAGQGKSRLAYELALEASKDGTWIAGLIDDDEILSVSEKLDKWQPNKPHLIIVDYVIGRTHVLRPFIKMLSKRQHDFVHPVRLLLLERQPWNQGINFNALNSRSRQRTISETKAEWFINITSREDGNDDGLNKSRYEEGVLELNQLNPEHLISIVQYIVEKTSHNLLDIKDADVRERIKEDLNNIDSDGRPLYAYFLAQALASGSITDLWTREDLLNATLERELLRWRRVFKGDQPRIGEDNIINKLILLATMTGGFNYEDIIQKDLLPVISEDQLKIASVFTGGGTSKGIEEASPIINPMMPDLLGEWLVIFSLQKKRISIAKICGLAWTISPKGMFSFVERLCQDFKDQPVVKEILNNIYISSMDVDELSKISGMLVRNLGGDYLAKTPPSKNMVKALHLAASHFDYISMRYLGWCYMIGYGVDKNSSLAFNLIKRAVEGGDNHALYLLGYCYSKGIGIKRNGKKSIYIFKKACEIGSYHSAYQLAEFYRKGIFVKKDIDKAIKYYSELIDSDKTASTIEYEIKRNALFELARIYSKKGNEDKLHLETAFKLYLKAYDYGHKKSARYLGKCYLRGWGVEENVKEALEYYESFLVQGGYHKIANSTDGVGIFSFVLLWHSLINRFPVDITFRYMRLVFKSNFFIAIVMSIIMIGGGAGLVHRSETIAILQERCGNDCDLVDSLIVFFEILQRYIQW